MGRRPLAVVSALILPLACSRNDPALTARLERLEQRVAALESAAASVSAAASAAASASAVAATGQSACAAAKVAARTAWESILPVAQQGLVDSRGPYRAWVATRPTCLTTDPSCPGYALYARNEAMAGFVYRVTAARDACSSGAYKLRDAANAVKPPKGMNVDDGMAASARAFEACKDSDP